MPQFLLVCISLLFFGCSQRAYLNSLETIPGAINSLGDPSRIIEKENGTIEYVWITKDSPTGNATESIKYKESIHFHADEEGNVTYRIFGRLPLPIYSDEITGIEEIHDQQNVDGKSVAEPVAGGDATR